MSKTVIQIADAEATYKLTGHRGDMSDHLLGLIAKYDLQALGYFIGSSGRVSSFNAEGKTGSQVDQLYGWIAMVVHHLDGVADDRKELGSGACVLVAVEADGMVRIVTWSKSKTDCAGMQPFVDRLFTQVSIVPFRTSFGWGNGGTPKILTAAEVEVLGPVTMKQLEGTLP